VHLREKYKFEAMLGGSDGIMCGITKQYAGESFLLTWLAVTIMAAITDLTFSGVAFYKLYWPSQVTYEKWCWKTNPKYPTLEKVRDELIQTSKGMCFAALSPAFTLWFYAQGDTSLVTSYGFCGVLPEYGWTYNVFCFFVVWFGSDFWEFLYHYMGHRFHFMWNWHRHHHVFFNPTPFAVIADEFVDQFWRALPLLVTPLVMPINLDVLFFTFTLLFYSVAVYHHCGYEVRWPNAHTGFFNTSYHHALHHSISINQRPYHCGFMFQIWDQLFGSVYKGECFCVRCAQQKGLRSREEFTKVVVPDYTQLLKPSFWISSGFLETITGTSAVDENEKLASQEKVAVSEMDATAVKKMT